MLDHVTEGQFIVAPEAPGGGVAEATRLTRLLLLPKTAFRSARGAAIHPDRRLRPPKKLMTYEFRSASLLDVPLIFDLMMEGSERGVFATRFSSGSGAVYLLWYILKGISAVTFRLSGKKCPSAWKIICFEAIPIGFFATTARAHGDPGLHLLFFSIKPDSRHRGHGKAALKQLIELQARDSILTVSCTKYAVCMQHILKKQRFQRDRRGGLLLEHYSLLNHPEAVGKTSDK